MPRVSTKRNVPTYTDLQPQGRNTGHRVLEAIARSENLMVVCGSGVSVAAGLPSFAGLIQSSDKIPRTSVTWKKFLSAIKLPVSNATQLQTINQVMATFRIDARTAAPTAFHRFLHSKLEAGECTTVITLNFDGLESRDRPELESKVVFLQGDNSVLCCSAAGCPTIEGLQVEEYDEELLAGNTVLCPNCNKRNSKRLSARSNPKPLRPNVLLNDAIDPNISLNHTMEKLLILAEGTDTLLIAGASLSSEQVRSNIEELVERVRANNGVVVFINNSESSINRLAYMMDFHLIIDVQACAEVMQHIIETVDVTTSTTNIWEEFREPALPSTLTKPSAPVDVRRCVLCGLTLEEALVQCVHCNDIFCFEDQKSEFGVMCVKLNGILPRPEEQSVLAALESFQCPGCFDHNGPELYPHLPRPPRILFEIPLVPPRLLLIVFYLSQFWPETQHTIDAVKEAWVREGWEFYCKPVPMHTLRQPQESEFIVPWDHKSYSTLVVYVTHGIRGNEFQIDDHLKATPQEFFNLTIQPFVSVIRGAKKVVAFMLTCGAIYADPSKVREIWDIVDTSDYFHVLVGTLNRRLVPSYLINLLCEAATMLLGFSEWSQDELTNLWLRDTLAATHTDLIYFETGKPPKAFLFSPFSSKPLGIPLPPILTSCDCAPAISGKTLGWRKVWRVKHNGHTNMPLNQVVVTVQCSACRRKWHLQKSEARGILHKNGGLYAAIVDCFVDPTQ